MASLYEIEQSILDCVDMETGEIVDVEKFDELRIDRDKKIESIALWYKNLLSEAAQYKAEKDLFADRQRKAESKADSLKKYIDASLAGKKFKTTKVDVTYRKSETLEYDGDTEVSEQYLKYSEPSIDKIGIKSAIKSGSEVPGFSIKSNINIQIK